MKKYSIMNDGKKKSVNDKSYNDNKKKCENEAEDRNFAFKKGKDIAKIWIKRASYQEIKDVMRRSNARYDANYFEFMQNIFFASIVKSFPIESQRFQNYFRDSFMNGWREGVINLYNEDD